MPLSCDFKFGNLTRTDGSALFACDNLAIQAAVIGPGEISQHRESPDAAIVDVSLKRLVKTSDRKYKRTWFLSVCMRFSHKLIRSTRYSEYFRMP